MEDIADKHIRLARALLNLGYSYLHTVDIENSEEESEESEKGEEQKEQVLEKTDKQHNDKVIEQELDKKTKQDLTEEMPQQFNRNIQHKSHKKLPVKIDTEKQEIEVKLANNDKEPKLNIDLSKGFNNSVQQKSECAVDDEFIGEVKKELSAKQKNLDKDEQKKDDKEYKNTEIIKECENENQNVDIDLLILGPENVPYKEIDFQIDLRVDPSVFQQKHDLKNPKVGGEKQKNIDGGHRNTIDKNIKHVVHKDTQTVIKNVQMKFVEANIPQDIEEDIREQINEGFQQNMEEDVQLELKEDIREQINEGSQQSMEKDVELELNKNLQVQVDSEVQQKCSENIEATMQEYIDKKGTIILQNLEQFYYALLESEQIIPQDKEEEDMLEIYNNKASEFIAKLTNLVKELELKHEEMLMTKCIDKCNKLIALVKKENICEKLCKLINEQHKPIYKKIDSLLNNNDNIGSNFNEKLTETIDASEEIPKESNTEMKEFENEVIQDDSDIEMKEFKDGIVQEESNIENEDAKSNVDVEGFNDKVQKNLVWNLQTESEIYADASHSQLQEESEEETIELDKDINIVASEFDDHVVESSSEKCYGPTNEESSSLEILSTIEEESASENEISSADDKFSTTDIQQKINQGQLKSIGSIHELENIQDLDEIPLKLKIQQEQIEEKLHQQMIKFQEEFHKNSKQEYNKDQLLKGNILNDPVYNKHQIEFYKFKYLFQNLKYKYRGLVLKTTIEAMQQIESEPVDMWDYDPTKPAEEPNIHVEDFNKELEELQRAYTESELLLSYNIPLVVDEKPSKKTKKIKYDLYKKLHEIHKKKLCCFADSKEWPEKYLYPSSLLDELFNDPSEVSPNVFVITLYSVDIGYSVKITMKKNKPPVETFYTYAEDSILDFVEKEELPPSLLHLLDEAKPCLFYNGRVIVEIHDKYHHEESVRVYRILLHPHALSIQNDVDRYIAKNYTSHCSYEEKLRLESKLLQLNFPMMCMASSPIAGLTVQLQHQLLSRRTITLNPLKVVKNDSANDNVVHHLLWKFDFRIQTFKLIKLYIFAVTETQEYSMLLCMNSKVPNAQKMRFKINLETNKLKPYIDVILEILKQKVNPDILVVRRYKSDDKSVPRSVVYGPLLNDKIFEPKRVDFCQILDELLVNIHPNKSNQQNTDKTKKSLKINKKMESKRKHIHSGKRKLLSSNLEINIGKKRKKQVQTFESKKSIPHIVESPSTNTVIVDSKSLKSSTIPIDIALDFNKISLPKECSTSTDTNSKVEPSITVPKSIVPLDEYAINVINNELDSILANEISLVSSPIAVSLLQSYTDSELPPVSGGSTTVMSVVPRYKTIFSSATLNTDYRLATKNVQRFEDHSVSKGVLFKPVIQSNPNHTKYLRKNDVSIKNLFNNVNSQTPLYRSLKANYRSESSSSDNKMENISVIKHVRANSTCIKGPEITIKNQGLPLIADLTEQFSYEPNATHNQFVYQETIPQLNDDPTSSIDSLSNLQVTLPNSVVTSVPLSSNEPDDKHKTEVINPRKRKMST